MRKQPSTKAIYDYSKHPKQIEYPELNKPHFSFKYFDSSPPWAAKRCKGRVDGQCIQGNFHEIAGKLKHYQTMTWGDIDNNHKRDHPVQINKLIPEAQHQFIGKLGKIFPEWDYLYRLRFTGEQRLWGIRCQGTFYIIWWDPKHEVCPSSLSHT